jgi:hypothetical protein
VLFQPKRPCKTASLSFSFSPNELPSVAVLQIRLGLVGNLMGQIGLMRRIGLGWEMGVEKMRVSLFLKI